MWFVFSWLFITCLMSVFWSFDCVQQSVLYYYNNKNNIVISYIISVKSVPSGHKILNINGKCMSCLFIVCFAFIYFFTF